MNEEVKKSKILGFRSGVLWKKIVAGIFYAFIFLFLVSTFTSSGPTKEDMVAKDNLIMEQKAEIEELNTKISEMETKISELEKDPQIAYREAIASVNKVVLQEFIAAFPNEKELITGANAALKEIEKAEKEAKIAEEEAKKAEELALKERGTPAGQNFYYKNVSFKSSLGFTDAIGEMRNENNQDFTIANFIISVYSQSDELLGTGYINISNFRSGQTKSFTGILDISPKGAFKYKIQFENAI